jgi:hypothetical protein
LNRIFQEKLIARLARFPAELQGIDYEYSDSMSIRLNNLILNIQSSVLQ